MRIYLDESELILKQLRLLYHELPLDLRSEKSLIPASELIVEAIEFLSCLKMEVDDKKYSSEANNNKQIGAPVVLTSKETAKSTEPIVVLPYPNRNVVQIQPILPRPAAPANSLLNPQKTNLMPRGPAQSVLQRPPIPNQDKPITIQTTDGRVISIAAFARHPFPAMSDQRLVRPPITLSGNFNVRGIPPFSQPFKMPITIMTKDSSGNDKPIKILPAPPGMQIPDVNGRAFQPPAPTGNPDFTPNKIVVESSNSEIKIAKPAPRLSSDHGLICPEVCQCPHSQDRAALTEKFKEKLLKYMASRLKILNRDSETCLTYNWIQDGIFDKVLMTCRRKEFFKFCRVIGPSCDNERDRIEKESCIILEKTIWDDPTKRGCIRVNGKLFSLPLLLVKLFREGFGEFPLVNLTVYSRPDCALSRGTVPRTSSLCINPAHYVYEPLKDRVCAQHQCSLRIRADVNGVKVVCMLCQTVFVYKSSTLKTMPGDTSTTIETTIATIETATTSASTTSNLKSPEERRDATPEKKKEERQRHRRREEDKKSMREQDNQKAPLFSVSIKAETFDEDNIEAEIEDPSASTFHEMEDEFEGMFRSFEQSVEEEEKMTKAAADNKSAKIKKVKNKNNFGNKDNVDSIEAVSFHLLQPKEELKEVEDELLRPESGSDEENRLHLVVQNSPSREIKDLARVSILKRNSKSAGLSDSSPSSDKPKRQKISTVRFQCWKCLEWTDSKESLANHSCLQKISSSDFVYVCHYCGFCSENLKPVRDHAVRCKTLGLTPLNILKNFKSVNDVSGDENDSSSSSDISAASRSKRHAKSSASKCEECGVTFAAYTELVLHMEKIKCKSIQCDVCNLFFANARTHQSHNCQTTPTLPKRVDADQDIVVVTTGRDKISQQPVKCQDCGNLFQSYEVLKHHQSVAASCFLCKASFVNTCKLLSHKCRVKFDVERTKDQPRKEMQTAATAESSRGQTGKQLPMEKEREKVQKEDQRKNKQQLEDQMEKKLKEKEEKHTNKQQQLETEIDKKLRKLKEREEKLSIKEGVETQISHKKKATEEKLKTKDETVVEAKKRQKEEPEKTTNKGKVDFGSNKKSKLKEDSSPKSSKRKYTSSEEGSSSSSMKSSSATPVRTSSRIKIPSLKARSPQPILYDDEDDEELLERDEPVSRRKSKGNK